MKRAQVTLRGAIVSLLVAAATAQPAAAGSDPQAATIRSQLRAQHDARDHPRPTGDVPRGNLRGDIADSVRSHPDAPRTKAGDRPHEGNSHQ
jgi:hypothetical protein